MMRSTYHHSKVAEYRLKANKAIHKSESLFGRNPRSMLIALLFTIADAVTLFVLWAEFLAEQSGLFIGILVGVMAICLDIPMSIAGSMIKACTQKLVGMKETVIITALALVAFLIVFIPNGYFRMNTRDQLVSSGDGLEGMTYTEEETTETTTAEEEAEDDTLKPAGWLMVLLPLSTSICSFVCGYQLSDPLDEKLSVLDEQIVDHENYITEMDAELAELGDDQAAYAEQKRQAEQKSLASFEETIESQGALVKQIVRVLFMEAMNDPDAISRIEENARALLEKNGVDLQPLEVDRGQILKEAAAN